ncbi:P1 family peptidase [Virgibacillus halophilus]|uniref:DmpA family aminopeptidase n=1 Tax=Tigheibacillus halophilus TaxID=361280 RepID=UPI003640A4E2
MLAKGKHNDLTDVAGVKVGHVTLYEKLNEQDTICTGVTAILPHSGNLFLKKTPAASYIINGFGKTCGLVQMNELGVLESPIMLTNTFSVAPVLQGTLAYMLKENKEIGDTTSSLNIVVGECNDSYLNAMRLQAVTPEHAEMAIANARGEAFSQGAVGAGKGMVCFGHKGGIGSASRQIPRQDGKYYTIACLVLSNFGKAEQARFANLTKKKIEMETADGSIMMIVATDAPVYDRQLQRIAKRCVVGLSRTGSIIANGSGDIAIAFSNANLQPHYTDSSIGQMAFIRDDSEEMEMIFQAIAEVAEEAIFNALRYAETTNGRKGRTVKKAPI